MTLDGASSVRGLVDGRGRFDVAVPSGAYRVTATSPFYGSGRYLCRAAGPVVVVPGETRRVSVYCHLR